MQVPQYYQNSLMMLTSIYLVQPIFTEYIDWNNAKCTFYWREKIRLTHVAVNPLTEEFQLNNSILCKIFLTIRPKMQRKINSFSNALLQFSEFVPLLQS